VGGEAPDKVLEPRFRTVDRTRLGLVVPPKNDILKSIVSGLTDLCSKLSEKRSKFHDRTDVTLSRPAASVKAEALFRVLPLSVLRGFCQLRLYAWHTWA